MMAFTFKIILRLILPVSKSIYSMELNLSIQNMQADGTCQTGKINHSENKKPMAKRFTDTEKWKKPFIRGLQGAYKLLWFYILDDCDHAGIWQVDFEVARIRTGEQLDKQAAIAAFGDRIEIFAEGTKWFLRDFIEFQYGQLSEKNRMHLSVINILTKNQLGAYKGLISPQGYGQGKEQGLSQGQEEGQRQKFMLEFHSAFDEMTMENFKMNFKHLNVDEELSHFMLKCQNDKQTYFIRDSSTLRTNFLYQLKAAKISGNGTFKSQTKWKV